jgi:uncharacterized protein (DUF2235 family)
VLFDGTWNTRDDRTNVWRLSEKIAKVGTDGMPQEQWYDPGAGTNWYDRFRGGAFGYGTSRNIREGYRWVAGQWDDEQELYVFGFSRGAYTARSLVGLIRKCGLLKSLTDDLVEQAYDLYRDKDVHPATRRRRPSGRPTPARSGSSSSAYGIPSAAWVFRSPAP